MLKFVIAIALLVLPNAAQAQTPAPDAEVLAVVNRLIEGLNRGDSAMARSTFHAKARLITVDLRNPDRSAPRIEETVESFIQSLGRPRTQVFEERLTNVKTMIDGALASVWADYTFHVGTTLSHCGVDHFLLVKEGGAWKIIELADTRRRVGC
jgi:hypothetical protein